MELRSGLGFKNAFKTTYQLVKALIMHIIITSVLACYE